MINTLMNIVKLILSVLPVILLVLASKKLNLPKAERSKQFLMPIITIIYVILAMLFLNKINEGIAHVMKNLSTWLKTMSKNPQVPVWLASFASKASLNVKNFIKQINVMYWAFFISNILMVLGFMLIKSIAIRIIKSAVKLDGDLHTKVAENFYEYFSERGTWCVKENYVQARSLLKCFYYSALIISSILMMVSCGMYRAELLISAFYPVFGLLIVGELYFYLDGATKREYSTDILGEDEDAYKVVNYSLLRKFLRALFGDKLLSENTGINNALFDNVSTDEVIRELEKSEDPKIVNFATYIEALNATGFQLEHNYLKSTLDLLEGKSILFNDPFYNDLIPYAFYPMNRVLMSHRKVLVILGRHSIEDDVKDWIGRGIEAVTNIPFLWEVGVLGEEDKDLDIGIITRSNVLDIKKHNANLDFFDKVGYVVILEPSKLISTAQIGLNYIVKQFDKQEDNKVVYCMCDKNCDGLVDAMSHILMTNITEVSATNKHKGTSSYMCWDTDSDYVHHRLVSNISRYLGLGTELSFAALKNQVSKTKWFGGEAFPVTDMKWIAKQYYYELMKYAGISPSQDEMDKHFTTTSNFWSAQVENSAYLTVEDEANNMFEVLRNFSTRTTEQGFINVISSEYLLKDYMADNASIFETDAKAIPHIVADYSRSNRNTILRLILLMSTEKVSDNVLTKELSILGIPVFDLKAQLWYEIYRCFATTKEVASLPENYEEAVVSARGRILELNKEEFDSGIIRANESFNLREGMMEVVYNIDSNAFFEACVSELRSAAYITEDEKGERYYLGSELKGHIYQKLLPGQFFTFGGKYYEMQYLTADNQVLIRRAADHINGRPTYRQIRQYVISGTRKSDRIGAQTNVSGMKMTKEYADISVNTFGYYQMEKYNDFENAKRVVFEGEKNGIPVRKYANKEILKIELPDGNGKFSQNVRYTITLLLNEVFRTLFPDEQAYICALTDTSFVDADEKVNPLTCDIVGDGVELSENAIYIIEDSQLDLGLTIAVERNWNRILQIIHDYIEWHNEALEASLNPPPEPKPPVIFKETPEDDEPEKEKKPGFFSKLGAGIKNIFKKIGDWFKKLFKKKDKPVPEEGEPSEEDVVPEETTEDVPVEGEETTEETSTEGEETTEETPTEGEETTEETPTEGEETTEETPTEGEETTEETPTEGEETTEEILTEEEEITEETSETNLEEEIAEEIKKVNLPTMVETIESNQVSEVEEVFVRKPYHERYYVLYGSKDEPVHVDLSATQKYLSSIGYANNPLKQAREGKKIADYVESTFKPAKAGARYCDFCGTEIYGVEYETLADGRDRCMICGRSAIKTEAEFRKLFEDVKRNMESFFGIKIDAGIRVEMVNSKALHRRLGKAFIPTPSADGRVLGVAISDKSGYTLMIENGSPRMASMLTMAHELTHIWQYINWNDKEIRKKYGKELYLQVYEGMAKWVEIQYAYLINEPAIAKREEIITSYRQDEYGYGFLRYYANYPFSLGTVVTKPTPFMNLDTPLDPQYCGAMQVTLRGAGPLGPDEDSTGNKSGEGGSDYSASQDDESLEGTIERTPDSIRYYAYELLDDSEKQMYDVILNAIQNFESQVGDLPVTLTSDVVFKISNYVQTDHPEIFWFQYGLKVSADVTSSIVSVLHFTYRMTKEEVKSRQAKIDMAMKSFIPKVTGSTSDYEIVLRVYENIIRLVDYDSTGLKAQEKDDDSSLKPDDLRSIYGVFVNKKAVCAGYAKATQYLLNQFGIECTYVTSNTHAWNLVKLEGDYYHLDTTWGDGSNTEKQDGNTEEIGYDYFCITSADLKLLDSHEVTGDMYVPECTATKCNYYHRNNLIFDAYDFARMRKVTCDSIKRGNYAVSIKCTDNSVYKKCYQELFTNGKFREIIQFVNLQSNAKFSTTYMVMPREKQGVLTFVLKRI